MVHERTGIDRIVSPDECSPVQIDSFFELVVQGGQVRTMGLRERIRSAHWLGFHFENGELVAIAALKRPAKKHRDNVFRYARSTLPENSFSVEIGWVFTKETWRGQGIAHRLIEKLLQNGSQYELFATTRTENLSMQSLLSSFGFERTGTPFDGNGDKSALELWIRRVTSVPARPASGR